MGDFFDSFFDSLSDKLSSFSFNEELEGKIIENKFFNSLRGKTTYDATILMISEKRLINTNGKVGYLFTIKCRPLDLHNFIIPEPCSFKVPSLIKFVVSLHPTAYSDSIMYDAYPLNVGDTVECFFDQQGPENDGKMRGLRFRSKKKSKNYGNFPEDCLKILDQAAAEQRRLEEANRGRQRQSIGGHVESGTVRVPRKIPKGNYEDKWFEVNRANKGKKRTIVYDEIRHKDCPCKPADPNADDIKKYFTPQQYTAFMAGIDAFESGKIAAFNWAGYVGGKQFGLSSLKGAGFISSSYYKRALKAGGCKGKIRKKKDGTEYQSYKQGCADQPKDHSFTSPAYTKKVTKMGHGILNYLKNNTWDGSRAKALGVRNLNDWFADKNGCQAAAMNHKTSGNIKMLKSKNAVDINNPCDMAGHLAASHLVGIVYGRSLSVDSPRQGGSTVPAGTDRADGNGSFATRYFIGLGNMIKHHGGCS